MSDSERNRAADDSGSVGRAIALDLVELADALGDAGIADEVGARLAERRDELLVELRRRVNDTGNAKAQRAEWKKMRSLTDFYELIGLLIKARTIQQQRRTLGSVQLRKPIPYKRDLALTGITAVQTIETNRGHEDDPLPDRTTHGLQVSFRLNTTVPDSEQRLAQGWVGTRDNIERHYRRTRRGTDQQWVQGHVRGRLWQFAEVHDQATEARTYDDGHHALTFVAQSEGRDTPFFFADRGNTRIDLPALMGTSDHIEGTMKGAKSAIGAAIMAHLNGSTRLTSAGMIN